MLNIAFASTNTHKYAEILSTISRTCRLYLPTDLGVCFHADEDFASFHENALAKARALRAHVNMPVLSEDSGLCVQALNGQPGVHSARFASQNATAQQNNEKLLALLRDTHHRAATIVCVFCLVTPQDEIFYFEGTCKGTIATHPQGERCFGYDPVFIPQDQNRT